MMLGTIGRKELKDYRVGSTRRSRILSHPTASGNLRPPVMDVVVIVVAVGQVHHLHADVAAGKLA